MNYVHRHCPPVTDPPLLLCDSSAPLWGAGRWTNHTGRRGSDVVLPVTAEPQHVVPCWPQDESGQWAWRGSRRGGRVGPEPRGISSLRAMTLAGPPAPDGL